MEKNTFDTIPMRMSVVLLIIPLLVGFVAATIYKYPDISPLHLPVIPFIICCCIWLIWDSLKSYRLDSSGITIFRLKKVIKQIPWDQVEQIGVAKRNDGVKGSSIPFLLIVLKGCERFDPFMDLGYSFCSRNKSMVITFDRADKYRAIFEKYYGSVDFDVTKYHTR